MFSWLRDIVRPKQAAGISTKPARWMPVSEDDMPDPVERAMYEVALNSAMQSGEAMVEFSPDGVTVNGKQYTSPEAARVATKAAMDAEPVP